LRTRADRILEHLRTWFYSAIEPIAPARLSRYRSGDILTRIGDTPIACSYDVERAMLDAQTQGRTLDQGWAEGMGKLRLIAANARIEQFRKRDVHV
jgi:hypothetical protein